MGSRDAMPVARLPGADAGSLRHVEGEQCEVARTERGRDLGGDVAAGDEAEAAVQSRPGGPCRFIGPEPGIPTSLRKGGRPHGPALHCRRSHAGSPQIRVATPQNHLALRRYPPGE